MRLTKLVQPGYQSRSEDSARGLTTRLRARAEREDRLRAAVEEERKTVLTAEDQVLARTIRLPADRPSRVAMVEKLRQGPGGRVRSTREVAAMMGLSAGAVYAYRHHPEKAVGGKSPPSDKPKSVPRIAEVNRIRLAAEPPKPESMGAKLKSKRKYRGITQVKLAEMMGVERELVAAWEKGAPEPPIGEFVRATNLLNSV